VPVGVAVVPVGVVVIPVGVVVVPVGVVPLGTGVVAVVVGPDPPPVFTVSCFATQTGGCFFEVFAGPRQPSTKYAPGFALSLNVKVCANPPFRALFERFNTNLPVRVMAVGSSLRLRESARNARCDPGDPLSDSVKVTDVPVAADAGPLNASAVLPARACTALTGTAGAGPRPAAVAADVAVDPLPAATATGTDTASATAP
jgi:hypothetical protein